MNKKLKRIPSMQSSIHTLLDAGVEIRTVLDVGVLTITQPLVEIFPNCVHHLFEPVDSHFESLRNNYRNIEHKLHHVALSNEDAEVYLACTSITRDGVITHSRIVDDPVTKDDIPNLVVCKPVRQARLDTLLQPTDFDAPCLLKVDVDGVELKVLEGAEGLLANISVIVVEAPLDKTSMPKFFERALYLLSKGYNLVDIVDLSYYDGVLWQADLVFVRSDIVAANPRLRPFQGDDFSFSGEKWFALNNQKFL